MAQAEDEEWVRGIEKAEDAVARQQLALGHVTIACTLTAACARNCFVPFNWIKSNVKSKKWQFSLLIGIINLGGGAYQP
jgi:hypothetical protein